MKWTINELNECVDKIFLEKKIGLEMEQTFEKHIKTIKKERNLIQGSTYVYVLFEIIEVDNHAGNWIHLTIKRKLYVTSTSHMFHILNQ